MAHFANGTELQHFAETTCRDCANSPGEHADHFCAVLDAHVEFQNDPAQRIVLDELITRHGSEGYPKFKCLMFRERTDSN